MMKVRYVGMRFCLPGEHISLFDNDEIIGSAKQSFSPVNLRMPSIDRVIFNGPATIVFWEDGSKTMVKCMEGDTFSYDTGIAMATLKKIFGQTYPAYRADVRKAIKDAKKEKCSQKCFGRCLDGRFCHCLCASLYAW
ncbi:MAG: hypothetical protein J6T99_00795, partial [Oscillospiraceae bacterium]|nr:hypothetical protein [Oscillospiraceae bacterium]